jgi:hypothetical protein
MVTNVLLWLLSLSFALSILGGITGLWIVATSAWVVTAALAGVVVTAAVWHVSEPILRRFC